jgi:hypothetical protein
MEGFSDSHLERELIAEATKLQRALWQALVNVGKPTTPVRDLLDLYNRANDQPTRDRNQKGAQYTGVVCAGHVDQATLRILEIRTKGRK